MAILIFTHDPADPPARLGRTLRDLGHVLRIVELHRDDPLPPDLDDVDGLISMGGRMNVDQGDAYPWMQPELDLIKAAFEAEIPIVGICLGAQLVATALGGEVGPMDEPEIGWGLTQLAFPGTMDPLYAGVPWKTWQFHAHAREIKSLPEGATPLSGSKACRTQAYKVGLRTYGFQYHFEWTTAQIDRFLDEQAARAGEAGLGAEIDIDAIKAQHKDRYPTYRQIGDRLCGNLATLLFAIDKRLGHHATVEPAANFKPARS